MTNEITPINITETQQKIDIAWEALCEIVTTSLDYEGVLDKDKFKETGRKYFSIQQILNED